MIRVEHRSSEDHFLIFSPDDHDTLLLCYIRHRLHQDDITCSFPPSLRHDLSPSDNTDKTCLKTVNDKKTGEGSGGQLKSGISFLFSPHMNIMIISFCQVIMIPLIIILRKRERGLL